MIIKIVDKGSNGYQAWLNGDKTQWEGGKTASEAIDKLRVSFPEAKNAKVVSLILIALIALTAMPAAAFTPPPGRGIPPVTGGGSSR
jgi:hypothetical protein